MWSPTFWLCGKGIRRAHLRAWAGVSYGYKGDEALTMRVIIRHVAAT